jgi:2,4-diketo-3-deoxy-L-fuconate hydrolase
VKLARARLDGRWTAGLVVGDDDRFAPLPGSVDDIVRGRAATSPSTDPVPLEQVQLGAPLTRFNRDILCAGWNYWAHFEESHGKREGQDPEGRPEHPTFFTKGPDTVIGPYDDVAFDDRISSKWDYEAEVAIVIGRDGRSIPEERAWEHIFGFCVANDISQRDLQRAHGGQWLKGKSIDATMPLGPWITTPDEIGDPYDLRIECVLNGETMQDASTQLQAFRFERLIAELSWGMTLRAGDVLLTGTPSGIGNARDPQVFLQAGDTVVTRVAGLGELRNRIAATALV